MKIYLVYITLFFVVIFSTSCNKHQEANSLTEEIFENKLLHAEKEQEKDLPICIAFFPEENKEQAISRSAIYKNNKWTVGQILNIRFLDGSEVQQSLVKNYAQTWEQYANIKFNFIETGNAELRISFEQKGSWSYIGKRALSIRADRPTMNLDVQFSRSVVLHEFGHALGLIHEHQHPENGIQWNKEAVYEAYGAYGWSKRTVDRWIFSKYTNTQTQFCHHDPASIMHYRIPKEWTHNGFEVIGNTSLSAEDKRFIGIVYPFDQPKEQSYPDLEYTNYFRNITSGWTAGSGAISVPPTNLDSTSTLWLFDYSYLNSRDTLACLPDVTNTSVLQLSNNQFITNYNREGTNPITKQLVRKENDQNGIYVPLGGISGTFPFVTFYNRFEKVNEALQFTETVIAEVGANAEKAQKIIPLPFQGNYGITIIKRDEYYYIYGKAKDLDVVKPIVARCPITDIYNFGNWEFYAGDNQWSSDSKASAFIGKEVAAGFSVFERYGNYYLLYQQLSYGECGKGRDIYIYI